MAAGAWLRSTSGEGSVGWAKRSVPTIFTRACNWWARRRCAFAHPTHLSIPSLAAQRRQADAGRVKTAVDGEDLPGDVARTIAAQEEHRFREFLFQAVTVERNGVVVVG